MYFCVIIDIEGDYMDYVKVGKFISLILRHHPEEVGITLDEHGWADVSELIDGINKRFPFTMEDLEYIVSNNNKKRYTFNFNKTKIRANQGHSIDVDVELKSLVPNGPLFHGTGEKYVSSIDDSGLIHKERLYVHLSNDIETAVQVGSRHGKPVVYMIDTASMIQDGYLFYKSENGVWLTKYVPIQYLSKLVIHNKLVRDHIPAIIQNSGKSCCTHILNDSQYIHELKKKLCEEALEVKSASSKEDVMEELGDVLEVISALIKAYEIDDVSSIQRAKANKNGAFEDRIFLEYVYDRLYK